VRKAALRLTSPQNVRTLYFMSLHSPEVDKYLEGCPPEHQEALKTLRKLIHSVKPGVQETIEFKMPTFHSGERICGLSSRKNYIAMYCKSEVVDRFRDELGKLNCGKGCIRFRKLEDAPFDVLKKILQNS
jgi:uncharacterized protein YdhG (YjbR/CyaY superfamily)